MKVIIANRKFMDRVVLGTTRQTVRVWNRKHSIKEGEIVALFNYRDKLPVRIISIREKKMDELNLSDARLSGYFELSEFKNVISKLYVNPVILTVIRFEMAGVV